MPHAIHDIGVASQIGAYSDAVEARPNLRWLLTRFLGDARPESMLLVIPQLVRPDFRVEIEIVAAKE
jgi:enamine deaminase RidA (YjgF/YER057c/UK114 family)